MNSAKAWVKALGVPPEQYEAWRSQSPDLNLLTFSCLENGNIPLDAYYSWAKEHYALPVLSSNYLEKEIPEDFWKKLENVANWSSSFMPVSEWDGVIFIACVEPRDDINWSFPVRYVLAKPDFLKTFWNKLQTSTQAMDEPLVTEEPIELDAPVGLTDQPPEINFDFSKIKVAGEEKETTTDTSKIDSKLDEDLLNAKKLDETQSLNIPPAPVEATTPVSTPPPLKIKETKSKTQTSSSYDLANKFFPKLKQDFLGGIVLLKNQESLVPIEWTSEFKPQGAPQSIANIDDPSAFRIVCRTQKPYLGHIVGTEVNNKFFTEWGFEPYPNSVLIQPVLSNSYMVAIFVAICDPNAKAEKNLSKARDLSQQLSQIFEELASKAA